MYRMASSVTEGQGEETARPRAGKMIPRGGWVRDDGPNEMKGDA